MVSKEEWVVWKNDKVTRFLLETLWTRRMELLEEWADDKSENPEVSKGRVQNLKDIIDYILHDFEYTEVPSGSESDSV